MLIDMRRYFTRFGSLTLLILAWLTVGTQSMAGALAAPTDAVDTTVTAFAKTVEAALHSTLTPTSTATPNKNGTVTAQANVVATAVAATLTANASAPPTLTPTLAGAAQIQTAVAATMAAQTTAPPADTPTPPPTPEPAKASTPMPTKTARPTAPPKATKRPAPSPATATPAAPARPDLVTDFENLRGVWQRGNEAWGTLAQSAENKTSGVAAAKLVYDFTPAQPENDFVIFLHKPSLPIPDQPTGLTMQVYGDGSGNFLNVWVQDSVGQIWQFTFGRINHTGWQMMSAPLDPGLGWPNGVVQNNQSAALSYPLYFYAVVLDGEPRQVMQGTLFFDDLLTTDNPARPNLGGHPSSGAAAPASDTPAAVAPENIPNESCGADPASITAGQTALAYWKFTGVKEVYFEKEGVLGIGSKLVKPGQTTTYTLHIIRSDGSETSCPITVQVQ